MVDTDFDYMTVFNERLDQEDRLHEAGFEVDGGGVDMRTGRWDIFVVSGSKTVRLSSIAEVTAYIDGRS
jgi:hypothetical protein